MKWAIREAIDVYFKAKSTFELGARTIRAGEPVLIFDTVKTSTLEVAAEISYVTGGRGNSRLLSYEGDKTLTFQFEEALLSNEGLAILSGADLIPARNNHLAGSHPEARSVIAHYTEKYSVATSNRVDENAGRIDAGGNGNVFPIDASITGVPMGGKWNVWMTEKPYVGQNSSIYVMLLDDAGEMSGAPLQINLDNNVIDTSAFAAANKVTAAQFATGTAVGGALGAGKYLITDTHVVKEITTAATTSAAAVVADLGYDETHTGLSKWTAGDKFIAFDVNNAPIATATTKGTKVAKGNPMVVSDTDWNADAYSCGEYDDKVAYYAEYSGVAAVWASQFNNYGDIECYEREITADSYGDFWGDTKSGTKNYPYLLAPSGGVAQPKAYRAGSSFVYKLNVPAILYQDIVLLDYYVEYQHDATQVSILPDKFGPYMYVEGSSLVRRASDGTDLPVEFVIPKFKITTALTFTLQSTGDPSTFTFQGDAYPDFSKFDLSRKVLADIQILDADDNYDGSTGVTSDPTSYRRYKYNNDSDGEFIWKDRSLVAHQNIDYSDTADTNGLYGENNGGPIAKTPGIGNLG